MTPTLLSHLILSLSFNFPVILKSEFILKVQVLTQAQGFKADAALIHLLLLLLLTELNFAGGWATSQLFKSRSAHNSRLTARFRRNSSYFLNNTSPSWRKSRLKQASMGWSEFVSWNKEWLMRAWMRIPQQSAICFPFINICNTQRAIKPEQEMEQAVFSRGAKCNYCTKLNKCGSKRATLEIRNHLLLGFWHRGWLKIWTSLHKEASFCPDHSWWGHLQATVDCNYHVLKSSSSPSFAYTSVRSMLRTGIWICLVFQIQKCQICYIPAQPAYLYQSLTGKI